MFFSPRRFVLVLVCFARVAAYASPMTLEDAVRQFSGAPKVDRARSAAEESSWKKVESYSGLLPSITTSGTYLFGKKYMVFDVALGPSPTPVTVPQIIPTSVYSLGVQWTIFDGFANLDRLLSASEMESASRNEFEWTKFQGEREVILTFYQAVGARTLKEVAEQNVKTIEEHLSDVTLLKKTGVGTKFDVLRVEVQASEAKTELLNAENNLSLSIIRLAEVLGTQEPIERVIGQLPELAADVVENKSLEGGSRKDLEALRLRAGGLDHASTAAAKHWLPKVSLYGTFQYYNNRNNDLIGTSAFRNAYSYGVQFNWNIFEGFGSYAKDRQATEQKLQAEKSLAIGENRARTDREQWKRKYLYYCTLYRARLSDVDKASESVRLAAEGRRVGTRTNSDLLDAELELFRARAGVVNAKLGAIESLVSLEVATGQKLYKFF